MTQETRIASRPTHDDLDVDAVSVVSEDSVLTTVDPAGAKLEWTHWRQELLDKLVLATLQEVKKAGPHRYLRSVASNVLFPEVCCVSFRFVRCDANAVRVHPWCLSPGCVQVDNGSLNWVPLMRARQLVRMLLLPRVRGSWHWCWCWCWRLVTYVGVAVCGCVCV